MGVLARALPVIREIVVAHAGQSVLVVSHKATLRLLLSSLLGFDARGYRDRLDQSPACLNVVDFKDPVRARLMLFNDVSHYQDQPRRSDGQPLEVVGPERQSERRAARLRAHGWHRSTRARRACARRDRRRVARGRGGARAGLGAAAAGAARGTCPRPCSRSRPRSSKAVEPVYPPEALDAKLSADVTMMIDIDATGHVTKVDVPKPVGHGFDEAAKAAVLQYEFSPAEIDGKPGADPHRVHAALRAQGVAAPPPAAPEPPPATAPAAAAARPSSSSGAAACARRARATRSRTPRSRSSRGPRTRPRRRPCSATVTDEDGRFVVKAEPGVALRVIVADPAHDPASATSTRAR